MELLNISEAKAKLSSVIERVVNGGEEFLIGKAGKPVAKIVRYEPARKNRRLGLFAGKIKIRHDFDEWPDDVASALGIK
jgi:prevent-host-death family protein